MNRLIKAVAVGVGAAMVASAAHAVITGSKHDFSGQAWANGQICLPCHAPHNNLNTSGNLLWNHKDTTASFTMYSSLTMDAAMPATPSASSKTCLSCHDGTVALDSFGTQTGTHKLLPGDAGYVGQDLSNDHPISFLYTASLLTSDPTLRNPTSSNSGLGGTIQNDLLFGDRMECASCHDVHNQYGIASMLRKSNSGSTLCLTCHNK